MESLLYEVPSAYLFSLFMKIPSRLFFCRGVCDGLHTPPLRRRWKAIANLDPALPRRPPARAPGLAIKDSLHVDQRQTHPTQTKPSSRGVEGQNLYSQSLKC